MHKFSFLNKKIFSEIIVSTLMNIPEIKIFIKDLQNSSNDCYVVGGFLRDILVKLIHNRNISPRDIDMVVTEFANNEKIAKIYGKLKRTPLGGYRIFFKKTELRVDIWSLEKTIFFRELGVDASLPNLLDGFPFDVERVAFDINRRKMINRGAIQAIILDRIAHNPCWIQTNRLHINAWKW